MSMFKGLKSKLAEETKKIQAAVANQVNDFNESLASGSSRNRDSEGPSSVDPPEKLRSGSGSKTESPNETTPTGNSSLIDISLDESMNTPTGSGQFSAFMQESGNMEDGVAVRQRRDSVSSIGSMDSVSVFPQFTPFLSGRHMNPIPSDLESTTDMESTAGSSMLSGASKEQISTVLHKLQGRASSYKERYRELGRRYNEVLKENEKCKVVLTTTQDKALRRIEQLREEKQLLSQSKKDLECSLRAQLTSQDRTIDALKEQIAKAKSGQEINDEVIANANPVGAEAAALEAEKEKVRKFEELLVRCKESIKSNKEKINALSAENSSLKDKLSALESEQGSAGISDLAAERVAAEWKSKSEASEKEWARKLTESDERSAMAVAQAKQDMHEELEKRDSCIFTLEKKIKSLESNSSSELVYLKDELGASKETENALEAEKKYLVSQLSKSKQEAVRLEEEQKQREGMVAEFQEKLQSNDSTWEKKIKLLEEKHREILAAKEASHKAQLEQQEEQMQLAIEEREMQKVAAVTEQDKKNDRLMCQLEEMTTKKLQLETSMEQQKQTLESKIKDLVLTIEENAKRHKLELEKLQVNSEETDNANKEKSILEKQLSDTKEQLVKSVAECKELAIELSGLMKEFEASREETVQLLATKDEAIEKIGRMEQKYTSELSVLKEQLDSANEMYDVAKNEKITLEKNISNLEHTLADRENQIQDLKQNLESNACLLETVKKERAEAEENFRENLDKLMQQKQLEASDVQSQIEKLKQAEVDRIQQELLEKDDMYSKKELSLKNELQQKNDALLHIEEAMKCRDAELLSTNEKLSTLENQIKDANLQVEELEKEKKFAVKEKDLQIKELGDLLFTLEEAVGIYRNQLQETENEKEVLQQKSVFEVSEQKHQMKEMTSRISDLEDAIDMYRKNSSIKSGEVNQIESITSNTVEMSTLQEKLSGILRDSFFAISEKDLVLRETEDRLRSLEEAVEVYKNKLAVSEETRQDMETQLEAIKNEVDRKNQDILCLEESIKAKDLDLISKTESANSVDHHIADLSSRLQDLERDKDFAVKEKEIQIQELSHLLGTLEEAVGIYRDQLQKNDHEKKALQQKSEFEVTEQIYQMKEMTSRIGDLEDAIDVYRKNFTNKSSQLNDLSTEVSSKNIEMSTLQEKLSSVLKDSFFAVSEKELLLKDTEEKLRTLEEAVDMYKEQLVNKEAELSHLKEVLKEAEVNSQQTSFLQDKISLLQNELENKCKENENYSHEIKVLSEKIADYQAQVIEINDQKSASENQVISELNETIAQIEGKLNSKTEALKKVKEQSLERLNVLKSENESLSQSVANQKELLEELKSFKTLNEKLQNQLLNEQNKVAEIQNQLEHYAEKTQSLESKTMQLTEELTARTEALEKVSNEQGNSNSCIVELQEMLQSCKTSESSMLAKMNAIVAEKDENIAQLMSRIEYEASEKASFAEAADIELQKAQEKGIAAVETEKALKTELEQLTQKASKVSSELQQKIEETKSQAAELDTLRTSIKQIKDSSDQEKQLLQQQAESKVSDYKKKAEIKIAQIKKQLEKEKEAASEELQRKISDLEEQLNHRNQQVDELSTRCSDLEEEVAEATATGAKNQVALEKVTELKQELVETRRKVNELESSSGEAEKLKESIQNIVAETEEQKLVIQQAKEDLENSRTSLAAEQKQLKIVLEEKLAIEDQLKTAFDSSQSKDAEFKTSVNQLETAQTSLRQLTDELDVERQLLKEKDLEIMNLQDKIFELTELALKRDTENKLNVEKLILLHEETETLRQKAESVEGTSETLMKYKETYESKINELVADHDEKVKTLAKEFELEMRKKEAEWQEEISGGYDKAEEDRQKLMKDYQKEVKQLYKDLNQKSQALDEARLQLEEQQKSNAQQLELIKKGHQEEIEKLSHQPGSQEEIVLQKETVPLLNAIPNFNGLSQEQDSERVAELESQITSLNHEIEGLKDKHQHEIQMLVQGAMNGNSASGGDSDSLRIERPLHSISLESFPSTPLFAEPAEAEYLRNVLYRYMTEREAMGKESVTLARVIATVLKFTASQTEKVVGKEEARQHTWRLGS